MDNEDELGNPFVHADFEVGTIVNPQGETALSLQFIYFNGGRSPVHVLSVEACAQLQQALGELIPLVDYSLDASTTVISPIVAGNA